MGINFRCPREKNSFATWIRGFKENRNNKIMRKLKVNEHFEVHIKFDQYVPVGKSIFSVQKMSTEL